MSEIFCQYCGAKSPSTHTFCENCGKRLAGEEQQSQPQQTTVQSGPYQPQQQPYSQQRTSMSGSYDAVPGAQSPYTQQRRQGMHPGLKVFIILMFTLIPGIIIAIIFFGLDIFNWFP